MLWECVFTMGGVCSGYYHVKCGRVGVVGGVLVGALERNDRFLFQWLLEYHKFR